MTSLRNLYPPGEVTVRRGLVRGDRPQHRANATTFSSARSASATASGSPLEVLATAEAPDHVCARRRGGARRGGSEMEARREVPQMRDIC
jgi:hypothetical protein